MSKVTKKASKKVTPVTDESSDLLDRIEKLEKQNSVLVKGLAWAGGEIKLLFGSSVIGSYLLEIAAKVEKAGK